MGKGGTLVFIFPEHGSPRALFLRDVFTSTPAPDRAPPTPSSQDSFGKHRLDLEKPSQLPWCQRGLDLPPDCVWIPQ